MRILGHYNEGCDWWSCYGWFLAGEFSRVLIRRFILFCLCKGCLVSAFMIYNGGIYYGVQLILDGSEYWDKDGRVWYVYVCVCVCVYHCDLIPCTGDLLSITVRQINKSIHKNIVR